MLQHPASSKPHPKQGLVGSRPCPPLLTCPGAYGRRSQRSAAARLHVPVIRHIADTLNHLMFPDGAVATKGAKLHGRHAAADTGKKILTTRRKKLHATRGAYATLGTMLLECSRK